MNAAQDLIKALTHAGNTSERSLQAAIGPSEIGGCRRRVYYRLNEQPSTNKTLQLPSIMGTAIHKQIEEALRKYDLFAESYVLESEWEYKGIKGHVDLYDKLKKEVVDWKTTTKKNLSYFPSQQQRWQVQVYGWLLKMNGQEVDNVTLVAIPRDGDERDIVIHTEPFNMEVAQEALDWLEALKEFTKEPEPEKEASFCKLYCNFYDESGEVGCQGRPKGKEAELPLIDDETFTKAAKDYFDNSQVIKELEKRNDAIKAALEGQSGQTKDGIKVIWSNVAGRQTIDEEAVHKLLGFVPKKTGKESNRLQVKE